MSFFHKFKRLWRHRILVIAIILAQLLFVGYAVVSRSAVSEIAYGATVLLSFFVVLNVIMSKNKPAYKISLTCLILLFPLVGGVFYVIYKENIVRRAANKRMSEIGAESSKHFRLPQTAADEAIADMPEFSTQIKYLDGYMNFPIYKNTKMSYFGSGEEMLESLCQKLKTAERYIFFEFFIVKDGKMWGAIEKILVERAANGVDVRLIYDDMGCFNGFSIQKVKELEAKGIKISVFNPFVPFISSVQNNRDHRKIVSIDGKTAFTGGVNIADEYINETHPHGHWKDAAVCLEGDGAWSFTVMLLQMWELCEDVKEDYAKYYTESLQSGTGGYVIPYTDSPIDEEHIAEHVYTQLIGGARDYLYITTPYLIVDDDILSSLRLAAKSGVDVRIITPHKYDKFYVHFNTQSYYETLIEAGVRIYEYTPGFIHSKNVVSDGKRAVVGTINLDFRSLYLHFECAALMYESAAVKDVEADFLKTLERCREITLEDCKRNIFVRFVRSITRLFAPLM